MARDDVDRDRLQSDQRATGPVLLPGVPKEAPHFFA
jgi:hypothetical protein